MSPRKAKPVPHKLMDVAMIQEEYGLPLSQARGLFRYIARNDGVVQFDGLRKVFVRREDLERRVQSAGGMRWL